MCVRGRPTLWYENARREQQKVPEEDGTENMLGDRSIRLLIKLKITRIVVCDVGQGMQPVRVPFSAHSLDSTMQRFWHQRLSGSRRRKYMLDLHIALGLVSHVSTF